MSETELRSLTTEERLLAAVSHASLLFWGVGLVAPIIIWATQRGKSKYVAFQAIQGLAYQLLQMVVYIVVSFLAALMMVVLSFATVFALERSGSEEMGLLVVVIQFVILFGILAVMAIYGLGGVVAAIFCLMGKPFRYPLLGGWISRFLTVDETSQTEAAHV